jgi:hypothetical protein
MSLTIAEKKERQPGLLPRANLRGEGASGIDRVLPHLPVRIGFEDKDLSIFKQTGLLPSDRDRERNCLQSRYNVIDTKHNLLLRIVKLEAVLVLWISTELREAMIQQNLFGGRREDL